MAPHTHSHSHGGGKSCLHASKSCRLGTVLLLTIGFFFVELICGYILHSVAIVADAIHMLSDSGALIIAMVSVRVSFENYFMEDDCGFSLDCKT
jgi:cobalt-zinc-cadmium efflux system protein